MNSDRAAPLLSIRNLEVVFPAGDNAVRAVRGLDLDVAAGTVHGLVGESGSGKSVTARAILGLLPSAHTRVDSIMFDGRELSGLDEPALRQVRGREISMVFQTPARYLNPAYRIGRQIRELIAVHLGESGSVAAARTRRLLDLVGLGGDERVLRAYPHQLSGGMKQRAMIAMALSCEPKLLIADEPTTALDVTIQRQILGLLSRIRSRLGTALLFISHDLGVVHDIADYVSVIYAGKIIEHACKRKLFESPLHPYTRLLLASIPDPERRGRRLAVIPGTVPDAEATPSGCSFHPRCPFAEEECADVEPALRSVGCGHYAACRLIGTRALDEAVGGRT